MTCKRGSAAVLVFSCTVAFLIFFMSVQSSPLLGQIKDRVVAYVDNTAITLSELEIQYADTLRTIPDVTREEVLETMINRTILLREARKLKLEAHSEEELLSEYIDLKIRAFIRLQDEELKDFYTQNAEEFQGREFEEVREEIDRYLIEKKLNEQLKTHLKKIRDDSCVQIQLHETDTTPEVDLS
jgi:hypothetical protein